MKYNERLINSFGEREILRVLNDPVLYKRLVIERLNRKNKDSKTKEFKLYHNSNLNSGSLFLDKGENKIIVEWPINSEHMIIYKKY